MPEWRKSVGILMLGLGGLLAGCAGGAGDMRPVMTVDGQVLDVRDPVENGRAQILTGQLGLAVDTLSRAVSDDPRNARALTLLAVAYGELKRFDLADRYHAEALAVDPDSVAALNNWGYSYLVRGDRMRATGLLERAAMVGEGRPIVAANLALARGDDAATAASAMPAAADTDAEVSIRLSEHVMLVRRTGRLVRLARGVQMLLTTGPAPQQELPAPRLLADAGPAAGMTDTRFALFRALFALVDGETSAGVAGMTMMDQLADASLAARPSPFGYFPDVDDFTRQ